MTNSNFTVILQGPVKDPHHVLSSYKHYTKQGFRVVLSTYKEFKYNEDTFKDCNVVLNKLNQINSKVRHSRTVTAYDNPVLFQALTVKSVLNLYTPTDFIIKIRTDEFYSDLSRLTSLLLLYPNRMVTGSTFFRDISLIPFCPSDHIVGLSWKNARKKYEFAYNLMHSYVDIAGYDLTLTVVPPEQVLFKCFLHNQGVDIHEKDRKNVKNIMKQWVIGVPNRELGDYLVRASRKGLKWSNYLEGCKEWETAKVDYGIFADSLDSFNTGSVE